MMAAANSQDELQDGRPSQAIPPAPEVEAVETTAKNQPSEPADSDSLYSILPMRQKQAIIMIVSFVAMISPLSGNIYYPAIPSLAKEFDVSTTLIQLTITVYQVCFYVDIVLHHRLTSKCTDFPRYRAVIHCHLLGQPWPETCICHLPRCLPGRQYWPCSSV